MVIFYSNRESFTLRSFSRIQYNIQQCTDKLWNMNTVHRLHVTDMIVGLTYLLLMSCDIVRNSSQALTSGGTAASNPPICCSTDVNCSIII